MKNSKIYSICVLRLVLMWKVYGVTGEGGEELSLVVVGLSLPLHHVLHVGHVWGQLHAGLNLQPHVTEGCPEVSHHEELIHVVLAGDVHVVHPRYHSSVSL